MQRSRWDSALIELGVIGVGAWGECFSNWPELQKGFSSGAWAEPAQLSPAAIPGRERRRAPQSVKMAVEVMSQACTMAGADPTVPAVVYASSMGDMTITDSLCRTLASHPGDVSPTQFHHSVHNAPIGYWSIATGSHQAANAVAGNDWSAVLGLLEAAIQCAEERLPVLFVSQEGAAPRTLHDIRASSHALALALLLAPPQYEARPLAAIRLEVVHGPSEMPASPAGIPVDYSGNPTAVLLPIFRALSTCVAGKPLACRNIPLPLSEDDSLVVAVDSASISATPGSGA